MKKMLVFNPSMCGSGDVKSGKIYEVIKDVLSINVPKEFEDGDVDEDNYEEFEYTNELQIKHPDAERWVTFYDESSTDSFSISNSKDDAIIFNNDNELAHELINIISGLDTTIVEMAMKFIKL